MEIQRAIEYLFHLIKKMSETAITMPHTRDTFSEMPAEQQVSHQTDERNYINYSSDKKRNDGRTNCTIEEFNVLSKKLNSTYKRVNVLSGRLEVLSGRLDVLNLRLLTLNERLNG